MTLWSLNWLELSRSIETKQQQTIISFSLHTYTATFSVNIFFVKITQNVLLLAKNTPILSSEIGLLMDGLQVEAYQECPPPQLELLMEDCVGDWLCGD